MTMTNRKNKSTLNQVIGSVVILIGWLILIADIIGSVVLWTLSQNLIVIVSGILIALGALFNIYLFSKEKSRDE
ncbi:hypothetical protein E4665_15305 [Sporolactobacillus shoreae]|uniref:Uncharacterized protein n=1 Tax=Sporolactobacillus shoreae TaxID=1465501 RepID=A0A4Z0GI10_9BACL|nr:hypothetical protein [Sporolactobacillus shoreae]TGA96441.1 hypothetical protein E4665_15305 [Sporolactobacillus shoreae]